MSKPVITRFPPSPTGYLHVGSVRTMLFNYLFAKQHGGTMRLRIEDTDIERSKPEYEQYIYESMKWLGIEHDGEVYRQSDRAAIYQTKLKQLIDSGHAYISQETPTEAGKRSEVIRFKNPNTTITFTDLIRGPITFNTTDLGDFIIAKSTTEPLYHLAVVVDDIDMGVTHVIRGEDHISNTPRQILLIEALGSERPVYAHLPLILATDRSKLSKRKHGESVATLYYRDQGFLPEALLNFMALLGWNPGTEQEVFSMDELVKVFSIEKIQKAGAIFNIEKLRWLNKQWLLKLPAETLNNRIATDLGSNNPLLIQLVKERMEVWGDVIILKQGEFDFFFNKPSLTTEKIVWKQSNPTDTQTHLKKIIELYTPLNNNNWNMETLKQTVWSYAEGVGRGSVLWPLRYALSGKDKSPDPFTIAAILGKEETLMRITTCLDALSTS